MSLYERDYLKRQLKQLALLVARLAGLKKRGQLDAAREEHASAVGELLGLDHGVLARIDTPTAARLLGTPERLRIYAELVLAEADLLADSDEQAQSEQRFRRAAELFGEVLLRAKDSDAEEALRAILARRPELQLPGRYRPVLIGPEA